jgi:hypothetical protein
VGPVARLRPHADYDTSIGAEVGGPIIKDRLFFWAGFAPRFRDTHVFRQTYPAALRSEDDGRRADASRQPDPDRNTYWRARVPESASDLLLRRHAGLGPRPEHHLTLAAMGSPNFNEQMRRSTTSSSSRTRRGRRRS